MAAPHTSLGAQSRVDPGQGGGGEATIRSIDHGSWAAQSHLPPLSSPDPEEHSLPG